MFLAAVFANWYVVVLLAPFLSLLFLLIVWLAVWILFVILDEGHHLFHRVSGAFD